MVTFIVLSTIGVSKEAQLRAAKIMETIAESCGHENDFFKFSKLQMKDRWTRLRKVVDQNDIFVVKDYNPSYSCYFQETVKPTPGKFPKTFTRSKSWIIRTNAVFLCVCVC